MYLKTKLEDFDWDDYNRYKNQLKHGVSTEECAEVFRNNPQVITFDRKHSQMEIRLSILGKTENTRKLNIIFTIRANRIRVISARDQNQKERKQYAKKRA